MVWDAGNDVGMINYIFLYIIVCFACFVIFSLGCFGRLRLWHCPGACNTARWGHNSRHAQIESEDHHPIKAHKFCMVASGMAYTPFRCNSPNVETSFTLLIGVKDLQCVSL